jgi:hypothetical protein
MENYMVKELEQEVETLLILLPAEELFGLALALDKLRKRAFYEYYLKFPKTREERKVQGFENL